ncbi:hypothetical protein [Azospirillum lipoferum]|uniref:AAA family ATPase n=1 Tax=Azospirillum lipoferum (strain 4B) TaxID=862719 RepID=G7Z8J5_AZOL4|nr:hypothetical protein [Azospirillum lipoferum]CBS87284.1 protein of unknown function [Azospirillum lipoferum 4B]
MGFTCKDVIDQAEILFAHTAAYNLPAAFANRFDSRSQLKQSLQQSIENKQIALIADMLGTGKTFLVEMVISEMTEMKETQLLLCGRNKTEAMLASARSGGAVFVDEWDIKANPKAFEKGLIWLEEYFNAESHPAVLIGDYTLRSPWVRKRLEALGVVSDIPMEPLSQPFFELAMRQRLWFAFKARYGADSSYETVSKEDAAFIDRDVLDCVVPPWQATNATFREVFRTLTELGHHIPVTDAPARIGPDEAIRWLAGQAGKKLTDTQQGCLDALVAHLRPRFREGDRQIAPWSLDDLAAIVGGRPDDAFMADVVEPLARIGIISSIGTPEVRDDGSYIRRPPPYLPGIFTRMQAMFGDRS